MDGKLNKGYFIDKWFAVSDRLHAQMQEIFTANGIPVFDLTLLPEKEFIKWIELYDKTIKVTNNISRLLIDG